MLTPLDPTGKEADRRSVIGHASDDSGAMLLLTDLVSGSVQESACETQLYPSS